MKWERGHRSKYVEDARGDAPPRGRGAALKLGGGGAVLLAIITLIAQAAGVNLPFSGSAATGGGGGDPVGGPIEPVPTTGPEAELFEFINFVVDDIQPTLDRAFQQSGKTYRYATLKVFREATDTACGASSSAIGPFYCPADEKAYIDLSFYRDLRAKLGAPGDFAQAYVLAHEFGHHAQNVLGVNDMVQRESRRNPSLQNELSVRTELQADCFAGVWAHSSQRRQLVESGDIEESLTAAAAIGDDRLQKMAGRQVNPETFTHGSSAQRVRWFKRGLEVGTLEACDTFNTRDL